MLLLAEVGVDLAPLLAAAGIGGLAIGFGAQNLVRDVITGFFILLEDHVRVGDVVRVGGKGGLVEGISLRVLTLRDFDGSVHLIPHGTIETITNMTKDFSYYLLDVGVAYREDVDEVMAVLKEVGAELRRDPEFAPDILEDLEVVGVDDFAASQVTIKVRIKTVPIKQWRVGRELRRRIKKAFDTYGIEIPFPHLTLYPGEPKRGVAPSLRVKFDPPSWHGPADQEQEGRSRAL
jgi:small conductance mechanosensitive channel